MKLLIVAVALAAFASAAVVPTFDIGRSFGLADTDSNGQISKAEFDGLYASFDDNADGKVNITEFVTHFTKTGMSVQGSLYLFFLLDDNSDSNVDNTEVDESFMSFDHNIDDQVSLAEYSTTMGGLLEELKVVKASLVKYQAMFDTADVDDDNMLSADELWSILSGGDTDGNGKLSQSEFTTYWMARTGQPLARSLILFDIFDKDKSGEFGEVEERRLVYSEFDYNNDTTLTKEEYSNAMLFISAMVRRAQSMSKMSLMKMKKMNMMVHKSFMMADTNNDSMISMAEHQAMVMMADDNQDGMVNISEFVHHASKKGMSLRSALWVFFVKDSNENDVFDKAEMDESFKHADMDMDSMISFAEFNMTHNHIHHSIMKAEAAGKIIDSMVSDADANNDALLTGDELWSTLSSADKDGDNMLTEAEFVPFWSKKFMTTAKKSKAVFEVIAGMDGKIGGDAENKAFFNNMDYNKDGLVSGDELVNGMLFIFARIKRGIMANQMAMIKRSFAYIDANNDSMIDMAEYKKVYKTYDDNMDGNVNLTEFVAHEQKQGVSTRAALWIFFLSDTNEDSMIDDHEIADGFKHMDKKMHGSLSFVDWKMATMMVLSSVEKAEHAGVKLDSMVDDADADKDGKLTGPEMWSTLSAADTDGDKALTEMEFTTFWSKKMMVSMEKSKVLYNVFDDDKDGKITAAVEGKGIYSKFDYNKDGAVSRDEFVGSMLFIFARITREMKQKMMMKTFNVQDTFNMLDNNTDGMISKMEHDRTFHNADNNMDGKVNITEFLMKYMKTGMSKMGSLYIFFRVDGNDDKQIDQSESDASFKSQDTNDDGMISFAEFSVAMNKTLAELTIAKATREKLEVLIHKADANMDHSLSRTEMRGIFASSDGNKDGLVSEAEFKKFWMSNTNEPEDRTVRLFGYLDLDNDGSFGNDNEEVSLFDSFDYNDDDTVSEEEFYNAMLFLFAQIMGDIEVANATKDVFGFFF